ncbi:MAG: HAD hydrolase family protein, partial [Leptolyngbya sp. SIO3F4]|nr:HAD hydrolase family protein [Leptolyngbya sp. SIO3F4]
LADQRGLSPDRIAFMGDDLPDLEVMDWVGYAIAPAVAAPEIIAVASYVTQARGGHGAVREAIEHVIRGQGRWDEVLAHYRPRSAVGGGEG